MTEDRLYRRIARRETHQSRSSAIVAVLVLVALAAVYCGIELALALLGLAPLVVSPADAVAALQNPGPELNWAAAAAAVFGLIVLVVAVVPSRRARHSIGHDRMTIVVDDGVLAGSLAGAARRAVDISQDRARASVSRRRAIVQLTPTSGVAISQGDAQQAADRVLDELRPRPRVRATIAIASSGVVGS